MEFSIKKLPLITGLVAIVLAIGLILFIGAYSKKDAFSEINIWGAKETTIESQNKDTDNDGLKDWQEDLYKTDPNNPDTDNDGYLDGEEVNSGHNPLVKAPGDETVLHPLPLGEKYNITQRFFQNIAPSLINSYLNYKVDYLENYPEITDPEQFLASVPESIKEQLIQKAVYENFVYVIENSKEIFVQFPEIFDMKISDQEINIIENNSKEAIRVYLLELSSFINSEDFFFQKNGAEILANAVEVENFSKLNGIIKLNDLKIEQMKQIPVPSSLKEIHKQALKISILARNIFVSIRDIENDPVKALLFSQGLLEETFNDWLNLLQEISDLTKDYEK